MHIPHLHLHFVKVLELLASAVHCSIQGGDLHVTVGTKERPLTLKVPVEQIAEHLAGRAVTGLPAPATEAFRAVLPELLRNVAARVQRADDKGSD